jgi:methylphosphotriester-DNA--protein-cysteine methyltransferase
MTRILLLFLLCLLPLAGCNEKEPAQAQNAQAELFVGSANSDKYHLPECKHAKNISSHNRVVFKNTEEAENNGYKACKVCKPNRIKK